MIDEGDAWRVLRDAAAHDWGTAQSAVFACAGGLHVTLAACGWRSEARVDAPACTLFDTLLPVATAGRSFVIAQLGQSLDGRIATVTGASYYVTGEISRAHLHRLRALVDAVVVGAGTVVADDPQLTVRHVQGRNPVRVILDPNARVPLQRKVFADPAAPTLHVVADDAGLSPDGGHVKRLILARGATGIEPHALLDALAERGLCRILIEGGGVTVSRFLQAGALDRLHVMVAPLLIGSGRPALTLPEITTLAMARRPPCRSRAMGADMLFDLDLSAVDAIDDRYDAR